MPASPKDPIEAHRCHDGRVVVDYGIMRIPKWIGGSLAASIAFLSAPNGGAGMTLPFLLLAVHLFTNRGGLEIDPIAQRYRRYRSYFGFSRGSWHSFRPFKAVLILPGKGSKLVPGPHFSFHLRHRDRYIDIYIADRSHRRKLFVKSFHGEKQERARAFAKGLSEELSIPIQKYAPKVSKKTKRRRKQRKRRRARRQKKA